MLTHCTRSFSWTTSMGNASTSSKPSIKSWILSLPNPLRTRIWAHSDRLRSPTVAVGGSELKLDQTFVGDSGGIVETRIRIVSDRERT